MADQEDQDFSKLPLDERIAHKNWKARASAYEELAKLFPTFEDKEFTKFSPLIKKFVLDANAAAQEKGLAAVLAYVDYCPVAGKYIEPVMAGVATKCLNSTRAKTKELAVDIVLLAVEIERQDVVLDELIKALEQKTPKNVAAVVRMITKALNQFGSKVIAIKPIVPTLGGLLEHKDPGIREETKQLCIEIYRWVKDALLPQLSNLKPILLDSLKEEFEKVKGAKAVPERLLRSQQQREAADEADGCAGDADAVTDGAPVDDEEADPFELLDPVDILIQLPSDFYPLLEAKKWQERKDALEKLQQLLEKNPKLLATADYGELVKQLKRIIGKDTNIVVATVAIKCLSLLCTGLRKGFDKHAHGCVSVLLEKFKEKKANVVASLREAIDAVYLSTNLEAIQEDLTTALDNKNPSIRSETALFMARAFSKTNPALVNKKLLKVFVTSLLKTLGDSDPTVRESSAEALGTAAKAQGDRNMGPLLLGLEQLKMAKIEEYKAKVEVKKFAALPPPAAAASAPPSSAFAPKPKAPARKPAGSGGARVVKPPAVSNAKNYSSAESLEMPDPPAPKFKTSAATSNRFGAVKSRLDTGNPRGGSADTGASASKSTTSTLRRPGTGTGGNSSGTSRLAKPGSAATSSIKKAGSDDSSVSPLMQPSRAAKEQRVADERSLKVLKWNFNSPREEFYVQLREQMEAAGWQSALVTQCFHADFKFHIKAIDSMNLFFAKASADPTAGECLVANIDLVLKWTALRFFDTNPSVIMKALDLLKLIFAHLEAVGYSMSDIEANSFLPYLVTKSGDAKDVVRGKVREILHTIRSVYAPAKIFSHLMDGLSSKNARQRTTCLEEIAGLIESEGMAIFSGSPGSCSGPSNSCRGGGAGAELKDIAKCVSERDTSVRNAALACIVKVYQYKGEDVYKLVGSLNDKDMSLIEERIKRVPKSSLKIGGNAHADTNGGSGLPTLGGGGGGILTNRFGATLTRQPLSAGSNSQHSTPESGPHPDMPRGGTLTKGTISKIGSLTNVSAGSGLSVAHTPTNFGATGSPYDTYQKPRTGGNTGTISKARSMIGLGLGPKANSLVGFGLNRAGSNAGTPLQSRLAFSGATASPAGSVGSGGGETSDTESGVNGFGEQQQMSRFGGRRSIGSVASSTATMEPYHQPSPNRETESSSMSVVTTSTEESDDLDRRVREALAAPEPDPEMIARIRSKFGSPSSIGTYGVSPPGASSFRSSLNGSYTVRSANTSSTPSANHSHPHLHHHLQSPNRSATPTNKTSTPALNPELSSKINDLFAGLSSCEVAPLVEALDHLNHLLRPYDAARIGPYLEPKLVQLVALLNKQLRLFLSKHYPEAVALGGGPEARKNAETAFRSVALTIANVFRCPLGRQVSRDTLRELITHILPFFLEDMKREENKAIFDSVNYVVQEVMKSADSTNFLSALIRMLHDYVGSLGNVNNENGGVTGSAPANATDLETFLSLTMKFIWRIVKFFDRHYEDIRVDVIMLESHLFFKSYPRSWWRSHNRDDLPLRTIKTLVYLFVRKQGDAILEQLNLIQCKDESELSYYVQKSLRQCELQDSKQANADGGASSKLQKPQKQLNSSSASTGDNNGSSPKSLSNGSINGSRLSNGSSKTLSGDQNENEVPQTLNGLSKVGGGHQISTSTLPRTMRPDFPLPTRQVDGSTTGVQPIHCTALQQPQQHMPIPVINNSDDLRVLCEYTSRTLNMPELNYAAIRAQAAATPPVKSVAEAEAVVARAQERLEQFKARLLQQREQGTL